MTQPRNLGAFADNVNSSGNISNDITIHGLTVGLGGGSLSTNTAVGVSSLAATNTGGYSSAFGWAALSANTSGSPNDAFGFTALTVNTTGSNNSAFGTQALNANTTGSSNSAVGRSALYNNTTASNNTAVGYQAGYSGTTATNNTIMGFQAGYGLTTGSRNTIIGAYNGSDGSGRYITTGNANTVIGGYNGNQGGLDIRTSSNNIVLSDGDGNPRHYINSAGAFETYGDASQGNLLGIYYSTAYSLSVLQIASATTQGWNTSGCVISVGKNGGTSRSINAGGTVNVSGLDYAEYMIKAGNFTINKGDICGIDANGKLTNVFANAISFVVKSTNPSYVGGDTWFTEKMPIDEAELPAFQQRMEAARQNVDRIAFSGQVPVNVIGASVGEYIIPVANQDGSIGGQAVSESAMTLNQYMQAVGKVISVANNVTTIIVKVA